MKKRIKYIIELLRWIADGIWYLIQEQNPTKDDTVNPTPPPPPPPPPDDD